MLKEHTNSPTVQLLGGRCTAALVTAPAATAPTTHGGGAAGATRCQFARKAGTNSGTKHSGTAGQSPHVGDWNIQTIESPNDDSPSEETSDMLNDELTPNAYQLTGGCVVSCGKQHAPCECPLIKCAVDAQMKTFAGLRSLYHSVMISATY